MSQPLVSIIVPTYRRPMFLGQALASVALQTSPDWECIVVDDGSDTDHELPDALGIGADPRFRLVRRDHNGGPGAARNSGLDAARGRYVTFLDDDDLLVPTRLALGLRELDAHADAVSVVAVARFDEHGVRHDGGRRRDMKRPDYWLRARYPFLGQVLVARRHVDRFDETFRTAEDADWWLRVAGDRELRVSSDVGYLLRNHLGPRPGIARDTSLQNRIRVFEKHDAYLRAHRRPRAYAASRVAAAALLLDERKMSAGWALRSLLVSPNAAATRVLARAIIGRRDGS